MVENYEYMQRVAKHFNVLLPIPTIHRKVITTDAVKLSQQKRLRIYKIIWHILKEQVTNFTNCGKLKRLSKQIDAQYLTSTQDKQILHEWSLDQKKDALSSSMWIYSKSRRLQDAFTGYILLLMSSKH